MSKPNRPQRRPRTAWVDELQYVALRLAAMVLHVLPVSLSLAAARLLGRIAYRLPYPALALKAHHARRNLQIAFGAEWSPARIDAVARASFENMAMLAVELILTPRLINPMTWARHVRFAPSVAEVVKLLLERKSAVAMVSAHYGNWEVLGFVLATLGFPNTSVARSIENARVNEALIGVREKTGQRIIDKVGAATEVRRVLDERGIVCILGDPSGGRKGVFANFFGVSASCHKTVGLLCLNERIPIVVGFARRMGWGGQFRFQMECADIIRPEEYDDCPRAEALVAITQRFTMGIERAIRSDPAQYLWVYRRYKSRSNAELTMCDDRWRDREDDILAGVCG